MLDLMKLYTDTMGNLIQGRYEEVEKAVILAETALKEMGKTTFTPETPRWENPTAWSAVTAAVEMNKGHYDFAEALVRNIMEERREVLGDDVTIFDNTSIRFLLIQILLEKRDYAAAEAYLSEISPFFEKSQNTAAEPYVTMYFAYLTYQGILLTGRNESENALEVLKKGDVFYESHKDIPFNGLGKMLPTFLSFYTYNQLIDSSPMDEVNEEVIIKKFNEIEPAFSAALENPNCHITKVQMLILKAKVLIANSYKGESDPVLAQARLMIRVLFPAEKNHPYLLVIDEMQKQLVKSPKLLSLHSFLALSIQDKTPDEESELRIGKKPKFN